MVGNDPREMSHSDLIFIEVLMNRFSRLTHYRGLQKKFRPISKLDQKEDPFNYRKFFR